MSSVQQALGKSFDFIGSPLFVRVDATPRSSNQATGANCTSVMQIMIRKMWNGHRVRITVFPANRRVTDEREGFPLFAGTISGTYALLCFWDAVFTRNRSNIF